MIGNRIAAALHAAAPPARAGVGSSQTAQASASLGDAPPETPALQDASGSKGDESGGAAARGEISVAELGKHNTEDSCWVSIDGKVYDFTSFLDEHPAGAEAILKYGGQDGSEIFHAIHTAEMLEDFAPIGRMV